MSDHLLPTDHVDNGFMFYNIDKIDMMQRSTGKVMSTSVTHMKANMSKGLFDEIWSELENWGQYKNEKYHFVIK